MPIVTRTNLDKKDETLVTMKISELNEVTSSIVKKETDNLLSVINELKTDVQNLKESNIELIKLLTNKNTASYVLENPNKPRSSDRKKPTSLANVFINKKPAQQNKVLPSPEIQSRLEPSDHVAGVDKASVEETDGKWSEVVKRKKKFKKIDVIVGNSKANTDIKGVAKFCHLHVYRLAPDMQANQLSEYLKSKNITDITCEPMTSKFPNVYSSFKVSAPAKYFEDLMKPETWPDEVCVNRFFQHLHKQQRTT